MQASARLLQNQTSHDVLEGLAQCRETSDTVLKTLIRPLWHHAGIILLRLKGVVKAFFDDVANIFSNENSLHEISFACLKAVYERLDCVLHTSSGGTS